jgi:predicted AlkP superfamily phosphohydrolase/phosphomutase
METSKKVLTIGLDGATWTVLTPWLEDGSLPNLASLRQAGCWGELLSTIPPLSAPAWSTFATGKNPGKHGVFHFVRQDGSDNTSRAQPKIIDGRSVKSPALWDILGHHNRTVGLINIPMTYPPRPVNGFMVTGLLTPPNAPIFTHPPELSSKLTDYQIDLDRFIAHKPFARDSEKPPKVEPSRELMQEFHNMMERRAKAALALMKSEPWDMFMVVFSGTDRMGHYLWPYHRDVDSDSSSKWSQLHQAIYDYYVRLDKAIGEMAKEAGKNATVIIMSDHGMGPSLTKSVHWNYWLRRKGLLSVQGTATSPDGWLVRLGLPRDKIALIARRIPGLIETKLVRKVKTASTVTLKARRTHAYYRHIYGNVGGIHINLQGEERERLRDDLIQALEQVLDPTTQQPIVRWTYRGEECYHGPYADNTPDIVLVMAPQYGGDNSMSHYSSIVTQLQDIQNSGGHQIEGIFVASGPEIESISKALPNLTIQDIVPTILYLMGQPIPSDMDGRVLTEIVKPTVLRTRPIAQETPTGMWPSDAIAQADTVTDSPSDDELIEARLRGLGYLS